MKNILLLLAVFGLATASQAQFSVTTFDGKTIANKNKPDTALKSMDSAFYFLWGTDFVRVQWQSSIGDKPAISEALLYYVDFASLPKAEEIPSPTGGASAYGVEFKSKKGASIPSYSWLEDMYSQKMSSGESIMFATKADMKKFFDKFIQKRKTAKAPVQRIVLKSLVKEKK